MKNLVRTIDLDENIDYIPQRLPIRFNLNNNNKIRDSWEDKWEDKHKHDLYWQQCKRIEALVEKSIGQPFSLVYSKVCKEYPKMVVYGKSLKDYFNKLFDRSRWRFRYNDFYYIDEDGLIQKSTPNYNRPKKSHKIYLSTQEKPVYKVNHNEIQNNIPLMNTIYYTMGKDAYYKLLDSDEITPKFYNEIKKATNYNYDVDKIIDIIKTKLVYDKTLHKYEYKRIKAEDDDLKKKKLREYKKEQEEYKDGLVQYLTWKRKQEANPEPDEQNRDRHGFDKWSFKKMKEG